MIPTYFKYLLNINHRFNYSLILAIKFNYLFIIVTVFYFGINFVNLPYLTFKYKFESTS